MIRDIRIRNFKSLKKIDLRLGDLSVITGMNGVGKSSLIQSLLLIRQSYRTNFSNDGIVLDGDLTGNLGTVRDVYNVMADSGEIEISIDEGVCRFSVSNLESTILEGKCDLRKLKNSSLLAPDKFQYISASRISPGYDFRKSTYHIENKQLGKTGEFVVSFLAEYGRINSKRKKDQKYSSVVNLALDEKGKPLPLESQVNLWLNYVSEDVRLNVVKMTNSRYELNFEYYNGSSWESFTSENSAFGLTYSLPVITALLAASPGDLVIIENPESDLHPQAQSKLGELIARCANAGVQIITETHSDHILNGIRVAISESPTLLDHKKIGVFYFYREPQSVNTLYEHIVIDDKGRMPIKDLKARGISGFFDQLDKDYVTLMRNQSKV